MIRCLIIRNTPSQQGADQGREDIVSGKSISIGRGKGCKIRLYDHRVALHHATLELTADRELYIQTEGEAGIVVNGTNVKDRALLSPGDRIGIGGCRLEIDPKSAVPNLMLRLDMAPPPTGTKKRDARTLAELRLSKRGLSLMLLALLAILLFAPSLRGISPELDKQLAALPAALTNPWSPGPMMGGHAAFGAKCVSCHERPFQPVGDEACTRCHKGAVKHPMGEAAHPELFSKMRCATCHAEHREMPVALRRDPARCTSCHADIKVVSAKASASNIHDFATDHPPYRLTLRYDEKGRPLNRMKPSPQLLDEPGLKYSHQIHLDKSGVSSPEGDTVMACGDCHRLETNGMHFAPIEMKRDCQQSGCHALHYDEPGEGEAPHGSERDVLERLRGYYLRWLSADKENMKECTGTEVENPAERSMVCANELAHRNAEASMFDAKLGCGECHTIKSTDDPELPWKVAPVNVNRDWHANAVFPHDKHEMTQCTVCHDKTNSKTSGDVAMPPIEKCRECHAGNEPARGKVAGKCQSCHRFHGEKYVAEKHGAEK